MSPVGKDNGSCGNINLPCKTLNHAAKAIAKKNDVIQIDSQSGDILISRSISFEGKVPNMKFTSYNGRPTIKSINNDNLNLFVVTDAINDTVNMNLTFIGLHVHNIQLIRIKQEFDMQKYEVAIQFYDCIFNYDATFSYQLLDISMDERTRLYIEIRNCTVKSISKLKILKVEARAPNFFSMKITNSFFHNISNLLAYYLLEAENQHAIHIINSSFISEGKQIESTALMYVAYGAKKRVNNSSFELHIATCVFVNGSSVLQVQLINSYLPFGGEVTVSVDNSTFVGNGMTNGVIGSNRTANDNTALFMMKLHYSSYVAIADSVFEKNSPVLEMNGNATTLTVKNSKFVGNGIRTMNGIIGSDGTANGSTALFMRKSRALYIGLHKVNIADCVFENNIPILEMTGRAMILTVKNSKFVKNGIRMMNEVGIYDGTVSDYQALLIVNGNEDSQWRSSVTIADCVYEKNCPILKIAANLKLSIKSSAFVGNGIRMMNGTIGSDGTANGNTALFMIKTRALYIGSYKVTIADCIFEKNIPLLKTTGREVTIIVKNSKFVKNGLRLMHEGIGYTRTENDHQALLIVQGSVDPNWISNVNIAYCLFEQNIPVLEMSGSVIKSTVKNCKFVRNGIRMMNEGNVTNTQAVLKIDCYWDWKSSVIIADCEFEKNIPVLKIVASAITLTVKNCKFVRNELRRINDVNAYNPTVLNRQALFMIICYGGPHWRSSAIICDVSIADCIFLNNFSILSATGVRYMSVVNSKFIGNHGIQGTALTINKVEKIKIVNCAFKENQAVSQSMCGDGQLSGSGGALLLIGGKNPIDIEDSLFENNSASCYGDSVYINSPGEITLKNVSFKSSIMSSTSSGAMWYSISKSLLFRNVSFTENDTMRRSRTIYTANAKRFIVGKVPVNYQCPMGANVKLYSKTKGKTFAKVDCNFCHDKTYTLEESFANVRNFSASNRGIHSAKCQPCPFGATCISRIRPKMNFWGYIHKTKAHLISCPPGYCCQTTEECTSLESCNARRRGVLCGQCSEGYSQSVFSGKCIQTSQCNAWRFWGILIAICFALLLAITYLQDILAVLFGRLNLRVMLSSFPRRSNSTNSQMLVATDGYQEEQNTTIEETPTFERTISESSSHIPTNPQIETQKKQENTSTTSGLIKILFFYYQMNDLLVIYKSEYQLFIFNQIKSFFNNLFTLNANSDTLSNLGCPFSGMDIVRKRLIKSCIPFMMLGLAGVTLLIIVVSGKCIKIDVVSNYLASIRNRILVAILQTILLGYSSLTSNIFALLTCISMVDGAKILFIQGNINCYQTWQLMLLSFVIVWSLPLTAALYKASKRFQEKTLTIKGFFFTLMFPLPSVIYLTFKRALRQDETDELIESQSLDDVHNQVSSTTDDLETLIQTTEQPQPQPQLPQQQQQPDLRAKLLHVLASSFRSINKDGGRLQWEPVLIAQRLVLLTLHAFLTNPIIKALSMLATVILITCINIVARPFHSMFLNGLNNMYLLFLCMSGITNSLHAYIYIGETKPSGPVLDTLRVLDIIELAMHLLFPCVAGVAAIMIIITKLIHLLYSLLVHTMRRCKSCIT